MATYVARNTNNKLMVVRSNEDGSVSKEMVRLHNLGYTLYRISAAGGGAFLLTPQRPVANSQITKTVVTGLDLEDDT